ncbi:unnamed protein product [Caenorhabditis angaria]|uniref:K Homology domain-containing protein n=1 Tax=Caenorhabditis angaria TaxID=860376 RepID=A0A9P1N0I5_9PELO|nr:unnamed protein product [Caenorhabditis angaria]
MSNSEEVVRNSISYIDTLKEEREQLTTWADGLTHVFSLIDKEIHRVSGQNPAQETSSATSLSATLAIPVEKYPNYNFVGRILGPRGTTAKQLEQTTGCKIVVHGRKDAEQQQPLSIEISVAANLPGAAQKLEIGVNVIKQLLVPPADGQDDLKRQQLLALANMNANFRPKNSTENGNGDY